MACITYYFEIARDCVTTPRLWSLTVVAVLNEEAPVGLLEHCAVPMGIRSPLTEELVGGGCQAYHVRAAFDDPVEGRPAAPAVELCRSGVERRAAPVHGSAV